MSGFEPRISIVGSDKCATFADECHFGINSIIYKLGVTIDFTHNKLLRKLATTYNKYIK